VKRVVLAVLLVATAARADDDLKARADAVYKEGEARYAAKEYLAAAAAFAQSYDLDPDPAVLFNIAQAYRLGRACAQAARYYHEFTAKVPDPPEPDKLERYIAEMDTCAKAESAATKPTIVHDTKIVHDTRVVRVAEPVHHSLVLPIALAGAGLTSLVIGGWYTHDVHTITRTREALCPPGCVFGTVATTAQHLDQRGSRAELGEVVFYVAGGGALVAGAVLAVLWRDHDGDRVVVTPTLGGGTVRASWRF
jgi:hypothetical protein